MFVEKIDPKKLKPEFNILCQRLLKISSYDRTPFGMTWCSVEPGKKTTLFAHHDEEVFVILGGQGNMYIAQEERTVYTGDVIHIPQFQYHQIANTSATDSLIFLSIHTFFSTLPRVPKKQVLFSPPPTPNGPLHLGHLSGPYLGADIQKRYLKSRRADCLHITGSDDFQSHVSLHARRQGHSEPYILKLYQDSISDIFKKMNIEVDHFTSPYKNDRFSSFVRDIFQTLLEQNKIHKKKLSIPYCSKCKHYLIEALISGICPHCKKKTDGQCCETCGHVVLSHQVIDPRCLICGKKPTPSFFESYVFPVEAYRKYLTDFFVQVNMSSKLRRLVKEILKKDLEDFPLILPTQWGISFSRETHRLCFHPWFENFCRTLFYDSNNQDQERTYYFGFDNSYYYVFLIPTLSIALNKKEALPQNFLMNDFYLLEHQKFSTGQKHAIWAKDFLALFSADITRLYLSMTRPESASSNFSMEEFVYFLEKTGVQQFEGWIQNINTHIKKIQNLVPAVTSTWTLSQQTFYKSLNFTIIDLERHYSHESFSPVSVAFLGMDLMRRSYNFLRCEVGEISELSQEETNSLILSLTALKTFALCIAPIMPSICQNILKSLNQPNVWEQEATLLKAGTEISEIQGTPFSEALKNVSNLHNQKDHTKIKNKDSFC